MGTRCDESIAKTIDIGRRTFRGDLSVLEYELRLAPSVFCDWDFSRVDVPLEVSQTRSYTSTWRDVKYSTCDVTWCQKIRHAWHPLADYSGKFTVSSEEEGTPKMSDIGSIVLIRYRARKSFVISRDCRVDVTDTWSTTKEDRDSLPDKPTTEVELEYIGEPHQTSTYIQKVLQDGLASLIEKFGRSK